MFSDSRNALLDHYKSFFGNDARRIPFVAGVGSSPAYDTLEIFRFNLTSKTPLAWVYATRGLEGDGNSAEVSCVEVCLYCDHEKSDQSIAMILTALSDYMRSGNRVDIGHIVNFGQPIVRGSECEYGFISLPYSLGPQFETVAGRRCLWLIPITGSEREFALERGWEALESLFEQRKLQYWKLSRGAVV